MSKRKSPGGNATWSSEGVIEAKHQKLQEEKNDDGDIASVVTQRRRGQLQTTRVIRAAADSDIPERIHAFAKRFENDVFQRMKEEYAAVYEKKTDRNGWYKGVRLITGSRYEVKVLGRFMRDHFQEFPQQLVDYAETLALSDERVQLMAAKNKENYQHPTFSEWSMIVSEDCEAQSIHIDVPETNVQFGLVLNSGVPGTHVLQEEDYGPYTIEQVLTEVWPDAPWLLKQCLAKRRPQHLLRVLTAYGPLLRRRSDLERHMVQAHSLTEDGTLDCGDLICTSGGIPHAGPACPRFRMVMFGAVSSTGDDLYNVDDQYFPHTAVLFIIQIVWDHIDRVAKTFLLHKLAQVVGEYDPALVENHQYMSDHFCTFMRNVAKAKHNVRGINAAVAKFLKENENRVEAELFQYRPPRVWCRPMSSFRRIFREVFDDFKCA